MPTINLAELRKLSVEPVYTGGWTIIGYDNEGNAPQAIGVASDDEGLLEWFASQLGFAAPDTQKDVDLAIVTTSGRVDHLLEALQPIARLAEFFKDAEPDDLLFIDAPDANITVAEIRAVADAAAALTPNTNQARPPNPGSDPKPAEESSPPPAEVDRSTWSADFIQADRLVQHLKAIQSDTAILRDLVHAGDPDSIALDLADELTAKVGVAIDTARAMGVPF